MPHKSCAKKKKKNKMFIFVLEKSVIIGAKLLCFNHSTRLWSEFHTYTFVIKLKIEGLFPNGNSSFTWLGYICIDYTHLIMLFLFLLPRLFNICVKYTFSLVVLVRSNVCIRCFFFLLLLQFYCFRVASASSA